MMLSIRTGLTVICTQQIREQVAWVTAQARAEGDLPWNAIQIMNEQDRVVAPVIANSKNGRIADRKLLEVAPANLWNLFAHPDDSFRPIQKRIRIAPLLRDIDVLIAVRPVTDHRQDRPVRFREPGIRLGGPLHWCAGTIPLRQVQVIPHTDFVSIPKHRRSRQREHQAVREFETPPVAVEHGSKPTTNAPVVELHLVIGTEALEDALALLLSQTPKIKLIVIAQKQPPLCGGRARLRRLKRSYERPAIRRRECI